MSRLEAGLKVGIPCDVKPGAFPDEYLVTIESLSGPVSGFVGRASVFGVKDDSGYLKGRVHEVTADTVTVWIRGSFFTTTGLADLSYEWARSNLQAV